MAVGCIGGTQPSGGRPPRGHLGPSLPGAPCSAPAPALLGAPGAGAHLPDTAFGGAPLGERRQGDPAPGRTGGRDAVPAGGGRPRRERGDVCASPPGRRRAAVQQGGPPPAGPQRSPCSRARQAGPGPEATPPKPLQEQGRTHAGPKRHEGHQGPIPPHRKKKQKHGKPVSGANSTVVTGSLPSPLLLFSPPFPHAVPTLCPVALLR